MVGCSRPLAEGDIAYWISPENTLVGTDYYDQPVNIIKDDKCGLKFDEDFIICETCCRRAGIVW